MVSAPPKPEDRALAMAERILDLAETDWEGCQAYVREHVSWLRREVHGGPMIVIYDDQEPQREAVISLWEGEVRRTALVFHHLRDLHKRLRTEVVEFTPDFLAGILQRVMSE